MTTVVAPHPQQQQHQHRTMPPVESNGYHHHNDSQNTNNLNSSHNSLYNSISNINISSNHNINNNNTNEDGGVIGNSSSAAINVNTTVPLNQSESEHLRQLLYPPPTSMVLVAALQLLTGPLSPPHSVYLMSPSYLQNWILWAFHQTVPEGEKNRLKEILRLASVRYKLQTPMLDMIFDDPGPINANDYLSMEGHPLLLRPNVTVCHSSHDMIVDTTTTTASGMLGDGTTVTTATGGSVGNTTVVPSALRRARSLPDKNYLDATRTKATTTGDGENNDNNNTELLACAVPEIFYEVRKKKNH